MESYLELLGKYCFLTVKIETCFSNVLYNPVLLFFSFFFQKGMYHLEDNELSLVSKVASGSCKFQNPLPFQAARMEYTLVVALPFHVVRTEYIFVPLPFSVALI